MSRIKKGKSSETQMKKGIAAIAVLGMISFAALYLLVVEVDVCGLYDPLWYFVEAPMIGALLCGFGRYLTWFMDKKRKGKNKLHNNDLYKAGLNAFITVGIQIFCMFLVGVVLGTFQVLTNIQMNEAIPLIVCSVLSGIPLYGGTVFSFLKCEPCD